MIPHQLTLQRAFVSDHFHDLPGFVEARHGHNWTLEATILAASPDAETALDTALNRWLEEVDYGLLNDLSWLNGRNPTTEAMAEQLLLWLEKQGLEVLRVRIREKANYWAAAFRQPSGPPIPGDS